MQPNSNTPEPSIGTTPMIFSHAAYNSDPQSVLTSAPYQGFTGNWTVVWASDFSQANYAFVATDGTNYYVAIRGSILSFTKASYTDWFTDDFNVYKQEQWQWFVGSSGSSTTVTSKGAYDGLTALMALTDVTSGVTLPDYLITNAVNNNAQITVTGHSLGGNLSTVFAPYMQWYLNNDANSNYNGKNTIYSAMNVFTFAAPSAGNEEFASYYDSVFGSNAYRFYNTNDIIPNFAASMRNVEYMFNPSPSATQIGVEIEGKNITLSDFFEGVRLTIQGDMLAKGYGFYTQTNETSNSFSFTTPLNQSYTANTIEDWLEQASSQHAGTNYLSYFMTLPQPLNPAQATSA